MLDGAQEVYNVIKWGGFADAMGRRDVIAILSRIKSKGYYWDASTTKLRAGPLRVITDETPWVHSPTQSNKQCGLDHQIIFNHFGIIPQRCMECWKICATIPDFATLLKMQTFQITYEGPCKCGIELRDYTPKHYGAYFYNYSFDEGRDRYKVLKEQIKDEVSPDVDLIFKRACTEFELIKGPSPLWTLSEEEMALVDMIETYVYDDPTNHRQDKILIDHVMMKWFIWAHSHGDMTYLPFNDGQPLWSSPVTYHEGDREGIKRDFATCRAFQKHGVPHEIGKKILDANFKLAKELKYHPDVVFNMANNGPNTLRFDTPKELLQQEVPTELKGGDDRSIK